MPKGFVYILECSDGSYYTGSTINLELRIEQHQKGLGANHTKKRLPVKLVYFEKFLRIDETFKREKQIQGWSRKKKKALINANFKKLPELSKAYRDIVSSRASDTARTSDTNTEKTTFEPNNLIQMDKTFYSNGKLLLTGEYVVLDGAVSLAVPTKYGQTLKISSMKQSLIKWTSFNDKGTVWFETEFGISDKGILEPADSSEISQRLIEIFQAIKRLNPDAISPQKGYNIETHLDFPRNWGLGTSSTLINSIAAWTKVDAFKLLELSFGGSGYDIACAQNDSPITYQLENNVPKVTAVDFNPSFKEHLYFIHLNQKQNSREGIAHYRNQRKQQIRAVMSEINSITTEMLHCTNLNKFQTLINAHEAIISEVTNQPTVKELHFSDFEGSIKSLGAWGGDFVMVALNKSPRAYFQNKGFHTIIPYSDMVL